MTQVETFHTDAAKATGRSNRISIPANDRNQNNCTMTGVPASAGLHTLGLMVDDTVVDETNAARDAGTDAGTGNTSAKLPVAAVIGKATASANPNGPQPALVRARTRVANTAPGETKGNELGGVLTAAMLLPYTAAEVHAVVKAIWVRLVRALKGDHMALVDADTKEPSKKGDTSDDNS